MSSNCTFAFFKDGASDLYLKENDEVNDESDGSTPAKHVVWAHIHQHNQTV